MPPFHFFYLHFAAHPSDVIIPQPFQRLTYCQMTPPGDRSASLRQRWSSGQDQHRLWFLSVTDGALLSPMCDSIPEPFIPSTAKFTFSGEINHDVHELHLLNWLLQLFHTKVWQLCEKQSHNPYLFLCFSFIVLCLHWFPSPPASTFNALCAFGLVVGSWQ